MFLSHRLPTAWIQTIPDPTTSYNTRQPTTSPNLFMAAVFPNGAYHEAPRHSDDGAGIGAGNAQCLYPSVAVRRYMTPAAYLGTRLIGW